MSDDNITQEYLKSILNYDPDTGIFTWLAPNKYHNELIGKEAGSIGISKRNKYKCCMIEINGTKYKIARLAFLYMIGIWPTKYMDHINGDSADNRWINLREVSATANAQNCSTKHKRTNLPMGVKKQGERYLARITVNKKSICLGTYSSPEEAHNEYMKARREYFGEYNRL